MCSAGSTVEQKFFHSWDLAIVVIAVMVVIFAIVVGIEREDCGTARQLLVSDSSATVLGYFFLDCRAPKK